jgi:hypothetical protein
MDWNLLHILYMLPGRCARSTTLKQSKDAAMEPVTVVLKLNPQQLELLDKTIARGAAPDREALIRRALREYAASQSAAAPAGGGE